MGLSQSLYTGWTGLATHQRSMDNLAGNLSNINTIGYKKSDFLFGSLFKQALVTGGIPAEGDRSALNPKNVGLGVSTGAILNNFTPGPIETTNNPLDCAIDGNGFFMVNTPRGTALTRDGSFFVDRPGEDGLRNLCMGVGGNPVLGWNAVDGVATPANTVEPIRIPAVGDRMPGERTTEVSLAGILPSNTDTDDFNGSETGSLELMGNLTAPGSIETRICVAVSETDGSSSSALDEIREVKVRIDFAGGEPSGDMNNWSWTMTTVDWPEPGAPGVRIYPPAGDEEFTQGTVSFYNQGNALTETGLGEPVEGAIEPGPSRVRAESVDADGNTVTTSFAMPQGFTLDVSHMTGMPSPPVTQALGTWYVDGNPEGTMRRTLLQFDETVAYEPVTDANGVTTMEAVRRMEGRENSLVFTPGPGRDDGSDWTWTSSMGGDSGALSFNTDGDLVTSTQTGGSVTYDFSGVGTAGQAGILRQASQNGFRDGVLQEVTIDNNGKIWGRYSNDLNEQLAQLAVATVPNNNGLSASSGNLFFPNPAVSGEIMIDGANGMNGSGRIMSRSLEGSNVQLAQEFTNMISIERGYQFNSRIVTTSDEMLQTALQLIP